MVVQDQFQIFPFPPGICSRVREGNLGSVVDGGGGVICMANGTTIFSAGGGPQESGLTCNASASRKRSREDPPLAAMLPAEQAVHSSSFAYPNPAFASARPMQNSNRLVESGGASTSGRFPAPLAYDLATFHCQETLEIDALLRLQNERIRVGVDESGKRHCRALLSALDQQVGRRLDQKEAELEILLRRNAALEERIRQMSAENQIWFTCAKNNEAMVSTLRTSLEHALVGNVAGDGFIGTEGYGDTDFVVPAIIANDAGSCCFEGDKSDESRRRRQGKSGTCKACGERDVSVLLLPCRHLCLCSDCESSVETCPICHSRRDASIQIFLS